MGHSSKGKLAVLTRKTTAKKAKPRITGDKTKNHRKDLREGGDLCLLLHQDLVGVGDPSVRLEHLLARLNSGDKSINEIINRLI